MSIPHVFIAILNWNGWQDTIECLESIQKLKYTNHRMVVVDNGSEDDSVERILSWARGELQGESNYFKYDKKNKPIRVVAYDKAIAEAGGIKEIEQNSDVSEANMLVLIKSQENLGFAGGCNIAIRYALAAQADYIWLLNNDTIVESDSLTHFIDFLEANKGHQAGATGQIRLYDDPSRIWNCGGKLTWFGSRRYYHAEVPVASTPQQGWRRITFITGCSAIFPTSLFKKIGLLTDRFFFGEEDYEFSQRLKAKKYKIACLYPAVIYHKVSISVNKTFHEKSIGQFYIHYLNHFIDMRYYWSSSVWYIWRYVLLFYVFPMLRIKYQLSYRNLIILCKLLLRDSIKLDRVDKITFERAMKLDFGEVHD